MVVADELIIQIRADIKKLQAGMKKAKKSVSSFGKIAETAIGFNLASATAFATRAIVEFAKQAVFSAVKSEQAFQSFNLVVGETANLLLNDLKNAADGTISDLNLVSSANKALALGISQNKLPELMEVARARAKVMGITTTQAFNDISTGIGRQSRMILDNLGIILNMDTAYKNYAATLDKTADQLSEVERKEALAASVISESKDLVVAMNILQDTHATKLEKVSAAWDNFSASVGNAIVQMADFAIFGIATPDENTFGEMLKELGSELMGFSSELKIAEANANGFKKTMTESKEVAGTRKQKLLIAEGTLEGNRLRADLATAKDESGDLGRSDKTPEEIMAGQKLLGAEIISLNEKIELNTKAQEGLVFVLDNVIGAEQDLIDATAELKKETLGMVDTVGGIEEFALQGVDALAGYKAELINIGTLTSNMGNISMRMGQIKNASMAPEFQSPDKSLGHSGNLQDLVPLSSSSAITINIQNVNPGNFTEFMAEIVNQIPITNATGGG